jgi:SAM-dependent methyltransferase
MAAAGADSGFHAHGRFSCRFCGAGLRETFVDLGMAPPSQSHVTVEQLDRMEAFFPQHVMVCGKCFLVQLPECVSASDIFSEYAYFSSYSDSWVAHARRYVEAMCERFHLGAGSKVVEIASNDGYLLQHFVARGVPVLGVEPAANVAKVAIEKGVPSVSVFFGSRTALDVIGRFGQPDLLLGNNVLAHVPDLNDFVKGMKLALKPGGVITMEFPHLERLIEENQFDTIYHEHFSYFSFATAERVFAAHGLALFDVEELPTHGGSLRIFGRHAEDASKPQTERARALHDREIARGFETLARYRGFTEQVKSTKRKLLQFLIAAKGEGKTIVGYGAPGKGNTLLNYCGIRTDFLDYTVDRNPYKQGKFTPGTHIPILPVETIARTKPDYILILPWNLREEIMSQMSFVREWGCRFVVPIPEVKVLG